MRKCSRCKKEKNIQEFHKNKRQPQGYEYYCKECSRIFKLNVLSNGGNKKKYLELMRKANKKSYWKDIEESRRKKRNFYRKREMEYKANALLNVYIKRGKVIKKDICEDCYNKKAIDGHHEDYKKPLEVIWLCEKCHGRRHRKIYSNLSLNNNTP